MDDKEIIKTRYQDCQKKGHHPDSLNSKPPIFTCLYCKTKYKIFELQPHEEN